MVSDKFIQEIAELIEEKMGSVDARPCSMLKNNGICLSGLSIQGQGSNIAPCIYLEGFYQDYQENRKGLGEIADEIIRLFHKGSVPDGPGLPAFTGYPGVRRFIHGRLVNTEKNVELLKRMPHRDFLDLSLIYCVEFPLPGSGGTGSVRVTDKLMGMWGITEQDLYGQALEKMAEPGEASLFPMDEVLADMGIGIPRNAPEGAFPMYILTNRRRFNGASQILNREALEKAAGLAGQDFFILPSSIHETILVPTEGTGATPEGLAEVVREVNEKEVSVEEFLSGHVYRYCAADRQVTIAA